MARFKGLVLLNARDFCVRRFGEAGWAAVLSRLPDDDRAIVESAVHVGWYDIGLYDRLHAAIAASVGSGPDDVMVELGHYCAERDLTTVHRIFMRMATPSFLLQKYGDYWRRYQDSGEWTITKEGDRRVRASLARWGSVESATCIRLGAYIQRFVELIGAVAPRVHRSKCRGRGDAVCEYVVEWYDGPKA